MSYGEVAAALDDWARDEHDPRRRSVLLEIARTVDPNPFRNRIRTAITSSDRAALVALARDKAADTLSATSVVLVADHLAALGGGDDAVALLMRAQARYPDDFWINQTLGYQLAFTKPDRRDEAIRFLTVAVALRPRSPGANLTLGVALLQQKKHEEAIIPLRRAIDLQPNYADAHLHLGIALVGLGRPDQAVPEYEQAIKLKPGDAYAYHNLGYALLGLNKKQLAINAFREVLRIAPNHADAYHFMGFALMVQGKREEAITAFKDSLKLNANNAEAHHNLGYLLIGQDKLEEAIRELTEAKRLKPEKTLVHVNLGAALRAQGKLDDALKSYEQALTLSADNPDIYCGYGECLRALGRYPQALAAYRKGHTLGSVKPDWYRNTEELIYQCGRLIEIGDRLPAMLKGEVPPRDNADRLILSVVCYDRSLYVGAIRFWIQALANDPKLADDRIARRRFHAACTAVMAGLGKGADSSSADESARAELRRKARAWLREELVAVAKLMEDGTSAHRATVVATLKDWKYDPRLYGVLDPASLAKLPEPERQDWLALWSEVDALWAKAEQMR